MKKIGKFIIFGVMIVFCLELSLQIGSLVVNYQFNQRIKRERSNPEIKKGIGVVCVGDSFTQGVGASSFQNSYPMQMQDYFNKEDLHKKWNVVNCGKAGTYSSELLRYLPGLIEEHSPRYVCILIGVNDSWNQGRSTFSIPIKDKALVPWELRFRTLRLFRMIGKYLSEINRKPISERTVKTGVPAGQNVTHDPDELWNKGNNLYSSGNFAEASEVFRTLISQAPHYARIVEVKIFLSYSLANLKEMDKALSYAFSARDQILNTPSPLHNHLSGLFLYLNDYGNAYKEIEQYEKFFPSDMLNIYKLKGSYFFETNSYDKAERFLIKALKVDNNDVVVLCTLARIYSFSPDKVGEAKRCLMKAYSVDKDRERAMHYMGIVDSSAQNFQEILLDDRISVSVDKQSALEFREMSKSFQRRKSGMEVLDLLKRDLSSILALCKKYEVTPVFMTYPAPFEVNNVIREFCMQQKVLFLDSEKIFAELLKTNSFDRYFVKDSHLNDSGYKILGNRIAQVLLEDASK